MATEKHLFHRAHYNAIAKDIRSIYALFTDPHFTEHRTARNTVAMIVIKLAARFKEDNPEFDSVQFLDQCSPDGSMFPLGELLDVDRED